MMKLLIHNLLLILIANVLFLSCTDTNSLERVPSEYADLPGTLIDRDTVWAGELRLKGQYYVLPGVTLTIRPGTTVRWEYHNSIIEDVGALITLPADKVSFEDGPRLSGKLIAEGTPDNPIVFTSYRENRRAGDWGGIVLAGDAPNNLENGTGRVEGLPQEIRYGGNNSGDNSGSLSYLRIEYGGFGFAPGSEINGLSLYSVGSGTILHHIQVYKSKDDGFEWFGGTVNTKYLVSMFNEDDSFDIDQGWTGSNQFWFGIQDEVADKGIEAGGSIASDDMASRPLIYNITLIGKGGGDSEGDMNNYGMYLINGFKAEIENAVITGFDGPPWQMDAESLDEYNRDRLSLGSILLYENGDWPGNEGEVFKENYIRTNPEFLSPGSPNYNYIPGSESAMNGSTPPGDSFFDVTANYAGAFNPESQIPWTAEGNWVRTTDD